MVVAQEMRQQAAAVERLLAELLRDGLLERDLAEADEQRLVIRQNQDADGSSVCARDGVLEVVVGVTNTSTVQSTDRGRGPAE